MVTRQHKAGSLPYRQLRKATGEEVLQRLGSLPYRQLRNYGIPRYTDIECSLPYRQLSSTLRL